MKARIPSGISFLSGKWARSYPQISSYSNDETSSNRLIPAHTRPLTCALSAESSDYSIDSLKIRGLFKCTHLSLFEVLPLDPLGRYLRSSIDSLVLGEHEDLRYTYTYVGYEVLHLAHLIRCTCGLADSLVFPKYEDSRGACIYIGSRPSTEATWQDLLCGSVDSLVFVRYEDSLSAGLLFYFFEAFSSPSYDVEVEFGDARSKGN
ncbi:hypothetical protein Salat_0561400 [Sesamum alatum]|uniref:Uncharacterized protein n=1 Tax=Sesamum alatum TaxID=300844 RepID=A0AAE1YPX1_9LAMI|nr:hypothetical protein Salat_0561400 [Sesamum alatum]